MSSKVLVVGGAGISVALVEAMLLADRGGMPVLLTPPSRFEPALLADPGSHAPMIDAMAHEQALRLGTDPMEEMLMRMIMPDRPRRPSLPQLLADLAALEIEALLARRPRPFRPTGNKRSRRRRKG